MTQALPKVLPVNELKNTANIMKTCQESPVPIVITRNGYGEAVMMSIALFEELFAKVQAAVRTVLENPTEKAKLEAEYKAQHKYGSLFGYAMHKLSGNYDENGDAIGG